MLKITNNLPALTIAVIFFFLTLINIIKIITKKEFPFRNYCIYIWIFFLAFLISEFLLFSLACWIWGFLCFITLREYFSLVEIRLQDRFGIWGAYLSIPFMLRFVYTNWYNMFIISIPVYSFLVIPILITLGGQKKEGTITSIGIIDFGLFLFIFCIGHIAYLSTYSIWMACMLVLNVIICDIFSYIIDRKINIVLKKNIMKYLVPVPFTITLTLLLSGWTTIPKMHSIILGLMIPALVIIGNHTITYIKFDLGITKEHLKPGKGLIIDNIQSFLYAAPVVFHYIRYFIL